MSVVKDTPPTFQMNTLPAYGKGDLSIKMTQVQITGGKNDKFTHINGRMPDKHKAPLGEWAKARGRLCEDVMLYIMHGRDESPDSGIHTEFL